MPDPKIDPIRPMDDAARAMAQDLLARARFAALAVLDPATGWPQVSRIALARDANGQPLTLISSLSTHTAALRADPRCSLLIGEPGPKGDPLTHPRITLQCRAAFTDRNAAEFADLRERYLTQVPKAKLYIDFADFSLVRLPIDEAHLNGGFGKAYRPSPADLTG